MFLAEANLLEYLSSAGFRPEASFEPRVEGAGEGSACFVRRARLAPQRSVIVKQAQPALEEPRSTPERILFEQRYAQSVAALLDDAEPLPPDVLHFDPQNRVLVLEDVGSGPDLGRALAAGRAPLGALRRVGDFLARVHTRSAVFAAELAPRFENRAAQSLHGESIFTLPYEREPRALEARTRAHAEQLLGRPLLHERIAALRWRYYETREALLHADLQSKNIVLQGERPRLLAAEHAHWGDPAFDLGIALAHVHFHIAIGTHRGPARAAAEALLQGYADAGGSAATLGRSPGYAGAEMLRRTLGAARLPWADSPGAAQRILSHGADLIQAAAL